MPRLRNPSQDDAAKRRVPVLPLEGLIRLDTVLNHYQVSRAQLYQEILEGTFPAQIKIGRSSFWDACEFRKFLKKHGADVIMAPPQADKQGE